MEELRNYEEGAREASVVVEKMRKKNEEAGNFLKLASTTASFLSDPTVEEFWGKRDTEVTDLVNTFMDGVLDVLAQADSVPTGVFFWVAQLEIMTQVGKL